MTIDISKGETELTVYTDYEIVETGNSGLDKVKRMLLDSVQSENTKRAYGRALDEYIEYHITSSQTALNRVSVNAHVQNLKDNGTSASSINQRLAAIKKFAYEALQNGFIDDTQHNGIKNIKSIAQRGKKLGNWLSKEKVEEMLNMPNIETNKGLRDRAILAIMFGAGLRREEVCNIAVNQLQQREGRWVIVDIVGKRDKTRSVPIASWVKALIDNWLTVYEYDNDSLLFVGVNKGDNITGKKLTGDAILKMIQNYNPDIAAHDLRRTFAKLAHKGNAPIEQISKALGHDSIKTTEIYLGTDLDLHNAASDAIKLNLA